MVYIWDLESLVPGSVGPGFLERLPAEGRGRTFFELEHWGGNALYTVLALEKGCIPGTPNYQGTPTVSPGG